MAGVAPAGLKTRASACAQCVERCRNEHGTGDISSITKKVNPAAIPTRHPCFIKTLLENGFRSWMVCESSSKSSWSVCRYILANLFALGGCSQDYIQSVTNEPCRIITVLSFVDGTYKLLTCLERRCRTFTLESQTSVSKLTLCKLSALVVLYLRSTITYTVKHRPNVRRGSLTVSL